MIRTIERNLIWSAACLTVAVFAAAAPAQSITFLNATTSSNYSNSGIDVGNAGFWFANFNASSPVSGAAIDSNAANSLPSWVTVNPAPDTTFASTASTKGGQLNWATLTLPDGTTGLSGAVVDSNTANNSNNTIPKLELGPGTPSDFLFHIVTDNTAGEHNPASRLRARGERDDPGGFDIIWTECA